MTLSVRVPLLLVAFAACSGPAAPSTFGAEPATTVTSQSQRLSIAVRTAPQPPTRGDQSAEYTITEVRTGKPVTGLGLVVVPWMPAHQHGASIQPTVTESTSEPGTYLIANVDFFMAGLWELRTTITPPGDAGGDLGADAGVMTDYAAPSFQIP